MSKRAEMIGRKFGKLTVISLSPNVTNDKRKRLKYYCNCDCGNTNVEIIGEKLRSGHTKSCGCLKSETTRLIRKKYNKYNLLGDYGVGISSNTNNKFYFDLEDYDKIKDYCWNEDNNGYMSTHINKNEVIYMHRLVMNAKKGEIIDHKEHNKRDNRKSKLRVGTQSNNMMNTSPRKDNTSGVIGVSLDKRNNRWVAEIMVDKNKINLGSYKTKEEAANKRLEAENKYFGNWSYKNSINL